MLFADDQVLPAGTEDHLQGNIKLNKVLELRDDKKISTNETKVMAIERK
jgi:hypothetical protein